MHIYYFGSEILRKRCRPVEQFDSDLVSIFEEMKTLVDQKNGAGLAAPQVGLDMRLFIARLCNEEGLSYEEWKKKPVEVFINPEITITSDDLESSEEGCLSLPGLWAEVLRPSSVKIKAQDLQGRYFERDYEGRAAHIILHENDHLNGVLYFDRLPPKEKRLFKQRLRKLQKEDPCYKNVHLD